MLSSIAFTFETYWMVWTTMFPNIPFWSPHGAIITPILLAALCALMGKQAWHLWRRG